MKDYKARHDQPASGDGSDILSVVHRLADALENLMLATHGIQRRLEALTLRVDALESRRDFHVTIEPARAAPETITTASEITEALDAGR